MSGQGADVVAKEYQIPVGTLRGWQSKQANGEQVAVVTDASKAEVGDLLLRYLRANLETLQLQQVNTFRDLAWLQKQDAQELAILHGVLTDKAIRLLEAMSNAGVAPDA